MRWWSYNLDYIFAERPTRYSGWKKAADSLEEGLTLARAKPYPYARLPDLEGRLSRCRHKETAAHLTQ